MTYKFVKHSNAVKLKKFLKKKLKKDEKVFRYNFHENERDKDQLMLIWQKKGYFHPPKKFLDTHKIYILMRGKLQIFTLDSYGKIKQKILLNKSDNICRIKKNVYHIDIPITNNTVHCEVTGHSFNNRKVKYLDEKFVKNLKKYIKL